jgi:lipoprotein-anchoring transpeptidase ErfK/SrfK
LGIFGAASFVVGCTGGAQTGRARATAPKTVRVKGPQPSPFKVTVTVEDITPKPVVMRLLNSAMVKSSPGQDGEKLGYIIKDTRVLVREQMTDPSCKRGKWYRIEPRGWVCTLAQNMEGAPSTDILPFDVKDGSDWQGVALGKGLELPIGFAYSQKERGTLPVEVRTAAVDDAPVVRHLDRREAVSMLERSPDGQFVRVGDNEWVASKDLKIAEKTEIPTEDVLDERWMDVNIPQQVAVVYEGTEPVFATLVSTGRINHRTPTGVFRISRKVGSTTMRSDPDAEEQYEVKHVPFAMYFHDGGYAAHGAYWHDGFGRVKSHGCVNLSPTDARTVYTLLGPHVPAGWNETLADARTPGSIIRVRNQTVDARFRGYAHEVEQAFRNRGRLAAR